VFLALVGAVLAVIVSVPPSERTDRVNSGPPPVRINRGGGGFLPAPDDAIPGDPFPPASLPIDRSGPTCTAMSEQEAATIASAERSGRGGSAVAAQPIAGSLLLYSLGNASRGEPIDATLLSATPVLGTAFVVTSGTVASSGTAPRPSAGVLQARSYTALERYEPSTGTMTAIVAFDNCTSLIVAPPSADRNDGHLWMIAGAGDPNGGSVLEVDPDAKRVLWADADVGHSSTSIIDGGTQVLLVREAPEGSDAVNLDSSTHAIIGNVSFGVIQPLSILGDELWALSGLDAGSRALVALDPRSGDVLRSFDVGAVGSIGSSDVHVSQDRVLIRERGAIVRRDPSSFAELSRLDLVTPDAMVHFGPDDVWIHVPPRDEPSAAPTVDVELRHHRASTGELLSTQRYPAPAVAVLSVDAGGFWYERLGRGSDDDDIEALSSEMIFRLEGT